MTDVLVDRLRIRGDTGRRLAAVAARLLPEALERALADVEDVVIDRLTVRLDFDPADYDDVTLATIWADRIRSRIATESTRRHGDGHRPDRSSSEGAGSEPIGSRAADVARFEALIRAWIGDHSGRPAGADGDVLAVLADRALVERLLARWDAGTVQRLFATLEAMWWIRSTVPDQASPSSDGRARGGDAGASRAAVERSDTPGPFHPVPSLPGVASSETKIVHLARMLLATSVTSTTSGPATTADAPWSSGSLWTEVGGLVLLYPWLADVCRRHVERTPDVEPVLVRRLVLARLADPERWWLVDDPLVRLLAGDAEPSGPPPPVPEVHDQELDGHLEEVLDAFARGSARLRRFECPIRAGRLDPPRWCRRPGRRPGRLASRPASSRRRPASARLPGRGGAAALDPGRFDPVPIVMSGAILELRTALETLESVIALRLEERKDPRGPLGRRLGVGADDEAIPPIERYRGAGPLSAIIHMAGLGAMEALILVAAVAPHVDEKFDLLYTQLTDRPRVEGLTGEVARTLAARTFEGRLRAAALLSSFAPLMATGLLQLDPPGQLAGRLRADPEMVRWVLGLPAEPEVPSSEFPARPLHTVHHLEDAVLPGPVRERLDELASRILHRELVVTEWGFGQYHDNSEGLVALFHGPPGTGKTMTAAALAGQLGMPAYVVDLSALVSKYIGETEKHLARVFERAARRRCMLVFDEADAVFGRRTEVSDSHDRYANQEVSYLLARIEAHPGVVVLTTNLLANIDEAFQRRIHVMIEFPEPGVGERVELWRTIPPPDLPLADDVDFDRLAEDFELTGAQIRDATIEAAYLAAADGRVVTRDYLAAGIRRQYEKAGRAVPR